MKHSLSKVKTCQSMLTSIVCTIALLMAGCSGSDTSETKSIVRPAKLVMITKPDSINVLKFPAVIEARKSSELTFQVGGLVRSLPVRDGQQVKRGAIIAQLDQRRFLNEVATAQAQFDSALSEFQRAARLIAEEAISRSVHEQRKAQRDIQRAALDSARKAFEDTVLRAPYAGIIATVHTHQFQNVQPNEPIVTLQSVGSAEAVVSVPSKFIVNSLKTRPVESYVVFDAAPERHIPGSFLSSTTQADPKTQTFTAKFSFRPPRDLIILPGMTGTVFVRTQESGEPRETNQTSVPLSAVLADGKARYVWVVDRKTMTVKKRKILLSKSTGENWSGNLGEKLIVRSGLKDGETIVGAGAAYLHDGVKIRDLYEKTETK